MALGARPGALLRGVLRQGLVLLVLGLALGIARRVRGRSRADAYLFDTAAHRSR